MFYLEVWHVTLTQIKQCRSEEEVDRVSCATVDRLSVHAQCTDHIIQREASLKGSQITVD